jgi:SAM-dependent methyltransferase
MHRIQAYHVRKTIDSLVAASGDRIGTVIDIGCGPKPYYPWLADRCDRYFGLDITPAADVKSMGEALPIKSGSADLVLCTQVLEHLQSPSEAIAEISRILAPGGVAIVTTHGVYPYHPNPVDFWRWTAAGLDKLFHTSGQFPQVQVLPCGGTTSCVLVQVTVIGSHVADKIRKRHGHWGRFLASLMVGAVLGINVIGRLADGSPVRHQQNVRPYTLTSNFVVVARK